ncbi:MAG: hypothetical protein R3195_07010 [Gemmatimonadota bacterium]|nr:hypothetical protein [Gemmatimonadota bacterium]
MSDFDRFVAFIRRVAGETYNAPPETPRDALWERVAGALDARTDEADGSSEPLASDDDLVAAAAEYHAPPVTPHDEMWERVEAAWEMRRAAPVEARQAGLDPLPEPQWDADGVVARRRTLARWGTAVAIAASLVFGVALGRTSLAPAGDTGPVVAANDGEVGPADATRASAEDRDSSEPALLVPEAGDALASGPLETAVAAAGSEEVDGAPPIAVALAGEPRVDDETVPPRPTRSGPTRGNVAVRLATARHLGQAETLLTSFRAGDAETGGASDMSSWAREMLGETRLLLDLPVDRPPRELALLEELELVLAQIAQLGPDAPTFEREIVADGLAQQGTIARLRAAAPPGSGASIGM